LFADQPATEFVERSGTDRREGCGHLRRRGRPGLLACDHARSRGKRGRGVRHLRAALWQTNGRSV